MILPSQESINADALLIKNQKVSKIFAGENIEGIPYILIYQYGLVEFKCQTICLWIDLDTAEMIRSSVEVLTYQEIYDIIR